MKYLAAAVLTLVVLQTAAVAWIAVSWELARRQTIAIMEETNDRIVSSEIVREVPVERVPVREIPGGFSESTPTATQKSIHITGVGSGPTESFELVSEGLWVVTVHYTDYEPPEVGDIPTVNLSSITGSRSAGWPGRSWNHIYVTADLAVVEKLGARTATFTPGEVVLHIADLPDDVQWVARFERLGELKLPER